MASTMMLPQSLRRCVFSQCLAVYFGLAAWYTALTGSSSVNFISWKSCSLFLNSALIYYNTRTCEVAQDTTFVSHLADAHTLLRSVCLDGVILRIELLYEWCDAIEIHLISDFDDSLTALYQLLLVVELHLINADNIDVVVIEDGPIRAQ